MSIKKTLRLFIFPLLIFIPMACYIEENLPEYPTRGIISSRPIAEWKLDDIEGTTAFDSLGNNHHGRVYGTTWSGNALSFDGVNDYVRIPNAPALNPTGSFSINAWIFPTTDKYGHILAKWGDTGDWADQRAYALSTCPGRRLVFGISDDAHQQDGQFHGFLTPEGVLTINAWNHVTAVYDKSTGARQIYVNGRKVAQRIDAPINLTMSRADVTIGAHLASSTMFKPTFFPGLIKQVKIYNYARNPAEIQADYNNAPYIGLTMKKHQPVSSDVTWTRMKPNRTPSARSVYAMSYDSARQKTVLFGGSTTGYDKLNDTWEWDGINWVRKRPINSPSPRGYLAMAYDSARQRTVLFGGGYYGSVYYNDTWEWDGTNWTLRTPATKPPARTDHALVYDSARQRIILFGGFYEGTSLNDTWEWDGADWRQLYPSISPPGRHYHAMAYDSARRKTVLFGGENSTATHIRNNETWEWNGINWTLKSPFNRPSPRATPAMAYDSDRCKTILFGGDSNSDTWEWDGINWTQRAPINNPSIRSGHMMVYDSARQRIVLFGGGIAPRVSSNETWEYRNPKSNATPLPNAWKHKDNMPTARSGYVSGVVNNKIYVIGGSNNNSTALNTNEEYDPDINSWTTKASMPTARANCSIGVVNNKIYVIGGWDFSNGCTTNEEYDPALNTWATKASMPTTRKGAGFGVVNNKIYVIGGENASVRFNTNEEYNPATNRWSTRAPMPSCRNAVMSAVVNGRIYIIGGANSSGTFLKTNQAYIPYTNTWVNKDDMATARVNAACDAVNNKIYVIGGLTSSANSLATNEEYNPAFNIWVAKTNMPTARDNIKCSIVNNKIYVIGGGASYLGGIININEQYDPSLDR